MMISFGMIGKDTFGDGKNRDTETVSNIRIFSRTREMNLTTQEAEEKRKQLLAKELAIKRNLSLVKLFLF